MTPRRFLLLNQYYAPDPAPTGRYLHDLARVLAARGHEITVIASCRAYEGHALYPRRERLDGVDVRRVSALALGRGRAASRVADYGSYLAPLLVEAMRAPRPDLVLSLTTPPFVGAAGALVARARGARRADWVMDLYPDVLAAHGVLAAGSRPFRALVRVSRRQLAGSDVVFALGPVMRRRVLAYAAPERVHEVPLWAEPPIDAVSEADVERLRRERGFAPGELVLMYSGNLGLGHSTSEFLELARRLGPGGPLWAFVGGGVRTGEVEAFSRGGAGARTRLFDYVPRSGLRASLASGDVHLVSLAARWEGLIVPSKLAGIFGVARPAIFVGGEDNEIAAWVRESGGGWLVREGDVEGLAAAVREASRPEERTRRGDAALAFARERFDRERNCGRMAELLERVAGRLPAAG